MVVMVVVVGKIYISSSAGQRRTIHMAAAGHAQKWGTWQWVGNTVVAGSTILAGWCDGTVPQLKQFYVQQTGWEDILFVKLSIGWEDAIIEF